MKYGEVEGYFGVLITLYHIRKLLSSHGIRPAFEMLEEKLQQGYFARFMSRNEVLWNAKLLMQQSLSHGVPSPKLSKMLEVLGDHFKKKDPKTSRVIIFSNFRGSVRDIMNALVNIREYVKATEFIGQSSGKSLKGQSQKVQQAVLEKFRAGGFNVIVATSIGEEGLDIMEVDLVLCFDANISPLRMIQRMGRTGRKHEGRVVVLACEGSELKGYMRKQASTKAIKKHMRNGGTNSFNFHSSPRMIPHIFKPEVQFVELSIEQFVPNGRKVKDDLTIQTSVFKAKLTSAETYLLTKYFHPTRESMWKPSLITFPHFQAFPSRVHKVVHSLRTGMLIDTMQCLKGLSFSRNRKAFLVEDEAALDLCLRVKTVQQHDSSMKDLQSFHNSHEEVLVSATQTRCKEHEDLLTDELCNFDGLQKQTQAGAGIILQTPISKVNLSNKGDSTDETPNVVEKKTPLRLADGSSNDFEDVELSPRLTNFILCGVVPESPIDDTGISKGRERAELVVQDLLTPSKSLAEMLLKSSVSKKDEKTIKDSSGSGRDVASPSINEEIRTPDVNISDCATRKCISGCPFVQEIRTPPDSLSNNSCSKDWRLSSGEKSESVEQEHKFKRLRRYGDLNRTRPPEGKEENVGHTANRARYCASTSPVADKRGRAVKKLVKDVGAFIEEEAEVSSEVTVSDDEEDEHDNNSYDNSFIDDRINTTAASTQAEASRSDMMAIYRRSLLSQSPMERLPNFLTDLSPASVVPKTQINESGSSAATTNQSLQTPHLESTGRNSSSERISLEAMPSTSTTNGAPRENDSKIESRKRKLSFHQAGSVPVHNFFHSEAAGRNSSSLQDRVKKIEASRDVFDDDQFYQGIDLDAMEEQAAKLLASKSELPLWNEMKIPEPVLGSPTFDLGI